ncbi:DUF1194 domain-containing protein [Rhizobiaceae bacterium BDR2-2]|uniref:DUF1194 domain-containing protein n=1 Tax=Ectorhizobium quercum TaxID=2965071 RepID=A0AAE3MXW5_9HYPH|nr:DUF1194 domain-containing protein [Ectorhizobium quercum]MCX8996979.1 DUF1194 domain-containing protein [Ectorhizobium quercum]
MRRYPSPQTFVLLLALVWVATATSTVSQAQQGDVGVGVELVLAVDASRSIDPDEQMIQRRGYAEAFRSPEVQSAILHGGWGRVAVTYVEWAGAWTQSVLVPWRLIDSKESAEAFAAEIEASRLTSASRTSISGAIDFSAGLFEQNGFSGERQVIDISGDGPNNQGRGVTEAREAAIARGITINGLPLMTNGSQYVGWGTIPDLDRYYAECVIGGPGAFSIPVTSWDQFSTAVRQKLVLELAGRQPARNMVVRVQAPAPVDCLVGETIWNERQRRWD